MGSTRQAVKFLLDISEEAQKSAAQFENETDAAYVSMTEDSYTIAYYAEKIAKYLAESPDSIEGDAHTAVLLTLEVMNSARQDVYRIMNQDKKVTFN